MAITFSPSPLCNIPGFFYPTTVLLVDDDPGALEAISSDLMSHYKTISFLDAEDAIQYLTNKSTAFFQGHALSDNLSHDILAFRREVYNSKRFQDVLISVIDYEMPNKTGFDVWKNVTLNDYQHQHEHSYILLTAKRYVDFEEELAKESIGKNFISKFDPNYSKYLLERINHLSADMFLSISHGIANSLVRHSEEKTSFLNDGNFLPTLNSYLNEQDICEGYLFDRQGSLMLLDKEAKLHWLFVRNDKGVERSIQQARHYGAPNTVIQRLESKKVILSLYEKEDFESRDYIDWDSYLLDASLFKDENKSLSVFNHVPSDYYYAFTDNLPNHGIDEHKICSYQSFLNQ